MLYNNKKSEEIAEVLSIRKKQENERRLKVRDNYHEKNYKKKSLKMIIKILNMRIIRFKLV
jgi:hypothetical protein